MIIDWQYPRHSVGHGSVWSWTANEITIVTVPDAILFCNPRLADAQFFNPSIAEASFDNPQLQDADMDNPDITKQDCC